MGARQAAVRALAHAGVLVLAGSCDRIVPPISGRILATLIPRTRLQIVDGGHLLLVSQAPQVMPMIDEFMAAD